MISRLLRVESSSPPQRGERTIVSRAGRSKVREMRENDAPSERRWIGRKAQTIPTGAKARAVEM